MKFFEKAKKFHKNSTWQIGPKTFKMDFQEKGDDP